MDSDVVLDRIKAALVRLVGMPGLHESDIGLESHLVSDLALTSLQFVDLTLALEEALPIGEYPIQEWLDTQQTLGSAAFRVRTLHETCMSLLT